MSPKQFFEEIGGPSLDSVRKHFEKLTAYGWLRRVRQRSEGPGRPAYLYRTTEQAVIDEDTWAEIPRSIQDAFTLQLMQQLSERLGLALSAGSVEGEQDGVFSLYYPVVLDEPGWEQGLKILGDCYHGLELEQTDAKVRLAHHGGGPILMVVAMAGFESPSQTRAKGSADRLLPPSDLSVDTQYPWTIRLAKLFGDPISLKIVQLLNEKALSPIQLEDAIGGASTQTFDRRCKLLVDLGWVKQVSDPRGGDGTRRILYRATSPAVESHQVWAMIPVSQRSGALWVTYRHLCELVFNAVEHGTLNARVDRHLTWGILLLDNLGRRQVTKVLKGCVRSLAKLERASKHRIGANTQGAPMTFFIGGFVSPPLEGLPAWGDLQRGAVT